VIVMTDRTAARWVGVLFVVATAAAIIGGSMIESVLTDAPAVTAGDELTVVSGVLLELVLVLAVVGIAALLFPVLRRRDEGLALGYLGVRMLEGVLLLVAAVCAMVILTVSDAAGAAGTAGQGALITFAEVTRDWAYLIGSMVALGVGGIILYSLLLTGRFVPAWLSIWGLLGAVLILARGVLELYGVGFSTALQAALAAPIALNEMVLAVWLIVRGFAPPATRAPRQRADHRPASV
jgi:hypothetical protein